MPETQNTLGVTLTALRTAFRQAGIESADLDARLIMAHILGISQATLISEPKMPISIDQATGIDHAMKRRLASEPVSRIIGAREFWGRNFEISSTTLDPRADTETAIEATLKIIERDYRTKETIRILDLGTGSGCILLTLLAEVKNAWGLGVDIEQGTLKQAQQNAKYLGVDDRAQFICADWTAPLKGEFDIVISNPPYIKSGDIPGLMPEVRKYDPMSALDGGDDGLMAYRQIIEQTSQNLKTDWIILELGAGQLDDVLPLLNSARFGEETDDRLILSDLSGTIRTVAAKQRCIEDKK